MKIISSIRIYKGMNMEHINSSKANLAAHRVTMKLREKGLSFGEYDHLYICFSTDKPAGFIELDEKADKYFPWFKKVCVGITADEFSEIETAEEPSLLFRQMENILLSLFGEDDNFAEGIKNAIEEAKKGPEMLMFFKEKKTAKGTTTVYLRLLDNANYLPLLTVANSDGEEIFRADLPETGDLITIGDILLSSKKVTVKPRKNSYSEAKGLEPVCFEIKL